MANPYEYIVFEPDQVLTNDHLNETFNYLDQQNRWTRNKLLGIGIVCGLDIIHHTGVIEITKGCGVTSQGYLILQDAQQYAYYISYSAPDQPNDLPFTYSGNLPFYKPYCQDKKIYLLLTDDQYNALNSDDQKNAITLSSAQINLIDYTVVLFLEAKEIDLKNCDMFDCNNNGERMMFAVKPLLVAKKDITALSNNKNASATVTAVQQVLPHEIKLKRFNVPYSSLKLSSDIINAFAKITDDFTLSRVANAYIYTYEKYKLLFDVTVNPFTNLFNQLISQRDYILKNFPIFIQYFYDFIDDLIKAYYEFTVKVLGIISACCPDENLFPLHLVLGDASKDTNAFYQDNYRQYFIYSPLFSKTGNETTEAIFLFNRMQLMVKEFFIPFEKSFSESAIKITPSQYEFPWLSERAVPYYYHVNEAGNELYQSWSYYKSAHGNAAYNLSYNANLYNNDDAVTNPLLYDIEHNNFFRVEGHIGHNYREALFNLIEQRLQYNLPFDVVAISADQLPTDSTNLPQCSMQDLETDYKLIISELACKLHSPFCFVSAFPYPPSMKTAAGTQDAFSANTLSSFNTFKTEALHTINSSLSMLYALPKKGDFMRKYCAPKDGTIGSIYLNILDEGGFKNPVQINSSNFLSLLYYHIFDFIDAVEELMQFVTTNDIATIDISQLQQKYERTTTSASLLAVLIAEYINNATSGDTVAEWLKELEMDLLAETFIEISRICLFDRIQTLKDEYNRRLLLYELQQSFYYYYRNHLGLEHKAGVPKGGTFVLVYHPASQNRLTTNNNLNTISNRLNTDIQLNEAVTSTINFNQNTINLIKSFVDECNSAPPEKKQPIIDILTNAQTSQKFALTDDIVIADFYVPYLCCSDCPPVAYVIPPSQDVKPTLSVKNEICSNEKIVPVTVSPIDPSGNVISEALSAAIIKNADTTWSLDASNNIFLAQPKLSGTLTYQLNSISSTPQTVTVYKFPDADFSATIQTVQAPAAQINNLNLTANETDETSMQYAWTVIFETGATNHYSGRSQQIAVGNAVKATVTLQVTNGTCVNQSTQDIMLRIAMDTQFCSDSAAVQIPVDGNASVSSEEFSSAVSKLTDGNWWFNPSLVDLQGQLIRTGRLNFQLNNINTEPLQVIVYKTPVTDFDITVIPHPINTAVAVPGSLTLTAKEANVQYNWSVIFNDAKDNQNISPNTTQTVINKFFNSRQATVTLEVTNGSCVAKSKEQIIDLTIRIDAAANELSTNENAIKKSSTKKTVTKQAKKKPK